MTLMLPDISPLRLELIPPGGGKSVVVNRWKSYNLSLTCRGVSSFKVEMPPTATNRAISKTGGHTFRLFYGDSMQFCGLVDERSEATRIGATDLQIGGRDMAGLLSDCTIAAKSLSISGKTLEAIATEWVSPWTPDYITGVGANLAAHRYIVAGGGTSASTVTSDTERRGRDAAGKYIAFGRRTFNTPGSKYAKFGQASPYYAGVGTEQIKTGNVRLGMTVWDGLQDLCAQIGVAPMCGFDGSLLLYRPAYDFDSTAYGDGLVLRWDHTAGKGVAGSNVDAVQLDTTISSRRSTWHVAGMGKSTKKSRGKQVILGQSEVKDIGIAFWDRDTGAALLHKPGVLPVPKVSNIKHLVRAARRHVAETILGGLSYEFMVPGHHAQNGVLWTPDTTVRVHDERNGIFDVYYIHSVERRFDMTQGRTSKLSLMPRDIWLGSLDDPSTPDSAWYDGMKKRVWW
jgi:prophage tail gpP-like protein